MKSISTALLIIFLFLGCSTKNEYNGVYTFDLEKIKNTHIHEDIITAKERNLPSFTLTIEDASVSLYGYQTDQPIRKRSYTACIMTDGSLELINKGFYEEDYCIEHDENTLVLHLVKDKQNKDALICANCEENGFPGYWIPQ